MSINSTTKKQSILTKTMQIISEKFLMNEAIFANQQASHIGTNLLHKSVALYIINGAINLFFRNIQIFKLKDILAFNQQDSHTKLSKKWSG